MTPEERQHRRWALINRTMDGTWLFDRKSRYERLRRRLFHRWIGFQLWRLRDR